MAESVEEAKARAEADLAGDLLSRLADRIGASASAATVFGEPVERDGVTVIPVARVRWGIGAGRGRGKDAKKRKETGDEGEWNEGSGGGGGVQAAPLGYIEVRAGEAHYRRVNDPLRAAAAGAIVTIALAVGLSMVVASLRSRGTS